MKRRLLIFSLFLTPLAVFLLLALLQPEHSASAARLALLYISVVLLTASFWLLGKKRIIPAFLARRLSALVLVLVGASTLVFAALRLAPGDPVDALLGEQAAPEDRARLVSELCLDRPLYVQYIDCFWSDVLDGSLGHSFDLNRTPVTTRLGEVFPATASLAGAGMAVAILLAAPLGLLAAVKRDSFLDRFATTFAVAGQAVPSFWLGPMLLLALTVSTNFLPSPIETNRPLAALVLPALTVGLALAGKLTAMIRASILETADEDYIVMARAKGLSESLILIKHICRNALIPVVTLVAMQLGALLTGTIITEKIFARPGLGTLLLSAIERRDYPLVQGIVLCIAATYVTLNLLVDVLYAAIDPRVRLNS